MSQLDEAIAEMRELRGPAPAWYHDAVAAILRRHFSEPPTVADAEREVFVKQLWTLLPKGHVQNCSCTSCLAVADTVKLAKGMTVKDDIDVDERNAGAESLANILLHDDGSGEMTPGPCADALAMVRRLKTDCDKAVLMADMIADKWTSENSKASLLLELEALAKEIDRLATALHANRCHPDYDYVPIWTTPALVTVMESGGWERCPESETHGILDEVWRRKREPA